MRVPRLSPPAFRRLTLIAALAVGFIIVTGGAVRITGSGLGCPDWPTCEKKQLVAPPRVSDSADPRRERPHRAPLTGVLRLAALVAVLLALAAVPATAGEARGAEIRVGLGIELEQGLFDGVVRLPDGRELTMPAPEARRPNLLIVPLDPAIDGVSVARWRAMGRDGHPAGGTFRIEIRDREVLPFPIVDRDVPPSRDLLTALGRLLALAGPLGLAGLVVLRALVVGPAWRQGGVAPPVGAPDTAGFRERAGPALAAAAASWWRAWWILAAAGAAGLALAPVALLWTAERGAGDLGRLLLDTRWGTAWIVQVAALAAAAGAAALLGRGASGPELGPGRALALGLPPAVALVAISWAGHAAASDDPRLDIAIDAIHNLSTAAWLGGLAALAVLLPAALRPLGRADRTRLAAGVVVRFSALALTAVGLLVATGVYRALVELPALGDLLDTGYGNALLVKLLIFVPLLGVGAYNRFVLHPRLERAAIGLDADDRGAAARLRTSVRAELALAGALMAAVAALVALAPPT